MTSNLINVTISEPIFCLPYVDVPLIAFSAYSTDPQIIEVGDVLQFPNFFINIGNAYSTNTSSFTCPYTGVYWFQAHLMSLGEDCSAVFVKDELELIGMFAFGSSIDGIHASNTIYVDCDEGSKVFRRIFGTSL